ncbi:MAG TPA: FkbM family methyltransferase [Caulobacteraceae bacterium]|jgi:FkbM family methyltransferase|nr:FkbM family methyltransferase [Caulobacteraceae bacterium]
MIDPELAAALAAVELRLGQLAGRLDQVAVKVDEIRQLVGPFGVRLSEGRLLVQSLHGQKYLVEPDDLIITPQLVVYRQWEADLSAFVSRTLGPDSVFVDVGANFGYFTCLAGSRVGRGGRGRVVAIEPNPAMLALLEANVTINWSMADIEILRLAAGATDGQAQLAIPRQRAANASLSVDAPSAVERDLVEVAVRPLDALLPAGEPVHVLKIDVEGHETAVIEGARQTIARSPDILVVMEWSLSQMQEAGYEPAALLRLLRELGLSAFALSGDGSVGSPLADAQLLTLGYGTLVLRRAVSS